MRRFRKEHSPENFSARIYTALMELKEGIHIVHCCDFLVLLAPSGALVFIMVYYISAAPTFSNFSNSSDLKVKVKVKGPNMCYIFEKHGIQGYRI